MQIERITLTLNVLVMVNNSDPEQLASEIVASALRGRTNLHREDEGLISFGVEGRAHARA